MCDVCNMVSLCLQVAGGPFPHPDTAVCVMCVIWCHYVYRSLVALSLILTLLCVCDVCNMVSLCLQVAGGPFPHPDTAVCVMCVIWCHYVYRSLVALSLILTLLCVCDVCNMVSLCLQVAGGPFPHPDTAVCV